MTESLSRPQALKRIIRAGVEPVLFAAGFERAGATSWVRHKSELDHMVGLPAYSSSRSIQWGIVCPEAVAFLWDKPPRIIDVAWSVLTGTPGTPGHPAACGPIRLDDENDPEQIEVLAAAVAIDMHEVDERMRPFDTRRQLRSYLLENRDPTDKRGFVVPVSLPLKLYTAAVLAVLDRAPDAADLVTEAEVAWQPWISGKLTQGRISRLKAAFSAM